MGAWTADGAGDPGGGTEKARRLRRVEIWLSSGEGAGCTERLPGGADGAALADNAVGMTSARVTVESDGD